MSEDKTNESEPRPVVDIEVLPPTKEDTDHCQHEITNQDLPDNRVKGGKNEFTEEGKARFLMYYARTGRKMASAKASGVTYGYLQHQIVNDPAFAELVAEAKQEYLESLEREAFRRGVEGVLHPIIGGKDPEIVTYVRKYSDRLLEMMLRKADPKGYGNKQLTIDANVKTGVFVAPSGKTEEDTPLPIEDV